MWKYRLRYAPLAVLLFSLLFGTPAYPLPEQAAATTGWRIETSAAAVHNLSQAEAAHTRVHLVGTITYYDPFDQIMFLHDATGDVYIDNNTPYQVRQGDLVSIDGQTSPTYRTQVAPGAVIKVLGHGKMPEPLATDYATLATGDLDCRLVRLQGVVRGAVIEQHTFSSTLHMDLSVPGGEVEVYVDHYARLDPLTLLGARIMVTGVAGGIFDTRDNLDGIVLYAQDSSAIHVIAPARVSPENIPLTAVDSIYSTLRVNDESPRLRVRGTVTFYRKGEAAVLESKGHSLYVITRETRDIAIGDVVDALGFASNLDNAPSLREAELLETGLRERINPVHIDYETALLGRYSNELVSLDGRVVSELHTPDSDILVIDSNGHLVRALLQQTAPLAEFAVGSVVRVTGICRMVYGGAWRAPIFFHLEMRSAADVRTLSAPSWWTVRHLAALLGVLLLVATGIATWAWLLRQRVVQQATRIARSMSIASMRSTILERISVNEPASTLFATLCGAVEALLPGIKCQFTLEDSPAGKPHEIAHAAGFPLPPLHVVSLLGNDDKKVGTVIVTGQLEKGAQQDEVFSMLDELAGLAMRQSLLHERLTHHSTHDPLTNLPNRRLCESRLTLAIHEASRSAHSLAVIYIDIDEFKLVNDQHGHRIGDLYLQAISGRLCGELRPSDTLARIGGDEFMVVVPTAHDVDAAMLQERLMFCFDAPFALDGLQIRGSASFGVACYPRHGSTREELERHADGAMYLSKHRNKVSPTLGDPATRLRLMHVVPPASTSTG